jgi:hypothetical protein
MIRESIIASIRKREPLCVTARHHLPKPPSRSTLTPWNCADSTISLPSLKSCILVALRHGIEDPRDQEIISLSHQNMTYTERYFAEMFARSCSVCGDLAGIGRAWDQPCAAMDQGVSQSQFLAPKGEGWISGSAWELPRTWRIRLLPATMLSILHGPWSVSASRQPAAVYAVSV